MIGRLRSVPGFHHRDPEQISQERYIIYLPQRNMHQWDSFCQEQFLDKLVTCTRRSPRRGPDDFNGNGWFQRFWIAQQEIHMLSEDLVVKVNVFVRAHNGENIGQGNFGADNVTIPHHFLKQSEQRNLRRGQKVLPQTIGRIRFGSGRFAIWHGASL